MLFKGWQTKQEQEEVQRHRNHWLGNCRYTYSKSTQVTRKKSIIRLKYILFCKKNIMNWIVKLFKQKIPFLGWCIYYTCYFSLIKRTFFCLFFFLAVLNIFLSKVKASSPGTFIFSNIESEIMMFYLVHNIMIIEIEKYFFQNFTICLGKEQKIKVIDVKRMEQKKDRKMAWIKNLYKVIICTVSLGGITNNLNLGLV